MSMNSVDQGSSPDGTHITDPAARNKVMFDVIRRQREKLPRTNANGYAVGYDGQSDTYRAAVTREQHVRTHGA